MPKTDWEAKLDLVLRRSCYTRQYQNVLQLLREFQAEAATLIGAVAIHNDDGRFRFPSQVRNSAIAIIESMLPPAKKEKSL